MKKCVSIMFTVMMTIAMGMTSYAVDTRSGVWKQDQTGWWWQHDDGTYPTNGWEWIDDNNDCVAQCYYFDAAGYMLADTTTPDNYTVNASGAWTVDGSVQHEAVVPTSLEFLKSLYNVPGHPEWNDIIYTVFEKYRSQEGILGVFVDGLGYNESDHAKMNTLGILCSYTYDVGPSWWWAEDEDKYFFILTADWDSQAVIEKNIKQFLEEAAKAKAVAVSLKADTDEETITNIINWVLENVEYDYDAYNSNDYEIINRAACDVFSKRKAVCEGYAKAVVQLCAMDGIEAYCVYGKGDGGESHSWNKIIFPDGERWVDTTRHTWERAVSDTLWDGYKIYTFQP